MAFIIKDRIFTYSNSIGASNFVLEATKPGYRNWSDIGDANSTYYTIVADNGDWEVGQGVYLAANNELQRVKVYNNSQGHQNKIVFDTGLKEVFCGLPAEEFNRTLKKDLNLSDLTDFAQARANLGLDSAALSDVVQTVGNSTSSVMSQHAVTDALQTLKSDISSIRDYVNIQEFGVVGDGVTDDTANLLAAHTYANSTGKKVLYSGVNGLAMQANAQIPIQTSVDFAGCNIDFINGIQNPLEYAGGFNIAFRVTDPLCPFETVSGTFSSANLYDGSVHPTRGVFDGQGFAFLTCTGFTVSNRAEDGTLPYTQSFNVVRHGKCTLPLSVDLSSYAATCSIKVRRHSKKRLRIDGLVINEGAWNKQTILKIERNNVDVGKILLTYTDQDGTQNINRLFDIENCADVTFEGIEGSSMQYSGISGTYVLLLTATADIRIRDITSIDGWGWLGSNNINGLYAENCHVGRIDCHGGAHNIFVIGGSLHEIGVCYGWGGGTIKVIGTKIYGRGAIFTRNDYGASFFGSLEVSNVDVKPSEIGILSLINLSYNPVGASVPVYMPKSISINGAKFEIGKGDELQADILEIAIKSAEVSHIYAPDTINISNIEVEGGLTPRITIPWGDFSRRIGTGSNNVVISSISTNDALSIYTPTPILTPQNGREPIVRMDISGVSYLTADLKYEFNYIFVRGGVINRFLTVGSPFLQVYGALFRNFNATSKVGGTASGIEQWTGLYNCVMNGNYDISDARVLNIIKIGSGTLILPSGISLADALSWSYYV